MNKNKFTPGPWKAEITNDYLGVEIWNQNTKIASINTKPMSGREVVVPNAALIAAAPEMLEFIEMVLKEQLEHGQHGDQVYISKAESIIKKAKGE